MPNYRVIFFDLDHTLWDYDKNSIEALSDLYNKYELQHKAIQLEDFLTTFTSVNNKLWNHYNKGHIEREDIREKRFYNILEKFGVPDKDQAFAMSDDYIATCPTKTNLLPYAIDVLEYLRDRYKLYLLTNGFNEVQKVKITTSNLHGYFLEMITSDSAGHRKPSKEMFEFAMTQAGTTHTDCIMIGDNLNADIIGAKNASIDTVYFNPHKTKHKQDTNYEVDCLSKLMNIL